jgi:hypothetical protein
LAALDEAFRVDLVEGGREGVRLRQDMVRTWPFGRAKGGLSWFIISPEPRHFILELDLAGVGR